MRKGDDKVDPFISKSRVKSDGSGRRVMVIYLWLWGCLKNLGGCH